MKPHILLLSQIQSNARRSIIETLDRIGISTFEVRAHASYQQLDDEFDASHAVLIVIDYDMSSPDDAYKEFELEIQSVLEHHYRNPQVSLIPIVERGLPTPKRLINFERISFDKELSPYEMRIVVEKILSAWRRAEFNDGPGMDELLVEARTQLPRLSMLIPKSRVLEVVALVLTAAATLAGIALSTPRILERWALPDYWLFTGPILLITGGLATVYLFTRERLDRKRTKVARLERGTYITNQ